jgi:hypothetical protein
MRWEEGWCGREGDKPWSLALAPRRSVVGIRPWEETELVLRRESAPRAPSGSTEILDGLQPIPAGRRPLDEKGAQRYECMQVGGGEGGRARGPTARTHPPSPHATAADRAAPVQVSSPPSLPPSLPTSHAPSHKSKGRDCQQKPFPSSFFGSFEHSLEQPRPVTPAARVQQHAC